MKANTCTLTDLFRVDVRYEMPPSQRQYVWNRKRQWEPLWGDIRDTAEAFLRDKRGQRNTTQGRYIVQNQRKSHFLGSVAVQQQTDPGLIAGTVETKSVIDGQQRLTTLQLAIHAAQVVTKKYDERTHEALNPFVSNYQASMPDDNYRYKIWSKASEGDCKAFIQAMNEDDMASIELSDGNDSAIVTAHRFFVQSITEWLDTDTAGRGRTDEERQELCESLRHTLLALLKIIVIDIEADADPRLVYETLNARGTSLTQSDLIKNDIMAPVSEVDAGQKWPFDDDWWSVIPEDEQPSRSRADVLLHHWITMRRRETGEPVHATEVFDAYSKYANSEKRIGRDSYLAILQDIAEVSKFYRRFICETEYAQDLIGLSSNDIVPVILWLDSATKGNNPQWVTGWSALSSFLARRSVCRKETTGGSFRRTIEALLHEVQGDGRNPEKAGDLVVDYLKKLVGIETSAWPDDQALRDNFRNRAIYIDPGVDVTRRVLVMLERGISLHQERTTVPDTYQLGAAWLGEKREALDVAVNSVEHIMPRAWRAHWHTSLNEKIEDAERRNKLLNTLGNLTLVTRELNNRLGNNEWRSKRALIHEDQSSMKFLMNRQLIAQPPDRWDVEEIDRRGEYLADVACTIWPGPNSETWRR